MYPCVVLKTHTHRSQMRRRSAAHWQLITTTSHTHILTHAPAMPNSVLPSTSLVSPQQQTFAWTKSLFIATQTRVGLNAGVFQLQRRLSPVVHHYIYDRYRPEVRSSCERRWSQRGESPTHIHCTSARLRLAVARWWLAHVSGWLALLAVWAVVVAGWLVWLAM